MAVINKKADEWNYKLLKETEVNGHKAWLVEALPASKEVENRYGFTKSVIFIRQGKFQTTQRALALPNGA